MTLPILKGPQDIASLQETLNLLILQINELTDSGTFTTGVRSTYDGNGSAPASSSPAGFEITSNYFGEGEVDFWSLVNNNEGAHLQGFYFYQKTAAGTAKNISAFYSNSEQADLDVYFDSNTIGLLAAATEVAILETGGVPLNFYMDATGLALSLTPAGRFILPVSVTPASSSAAGVQGTIAWDSGFLYVCISTNSWKRVAIAAGF